MQRTKRCAVVGCSSSLGLIEITAGTTVLLDLKAAADGVVPHLCRKCYDKNRRLLANLVRLHHRSNSSLSHTLVQHY